MLPPGEYAPLHSSEDEPLPLPLPLDLPVLLAASGPVYASVVAVISIDAVQPQYCTLNAAIASAAAAAVARSSLSNGDWGLYSMVIVCVRAVSLELVHSPSVESVSTTNSNEVVAKTALAPHHSVKAASNASWNCGTKALPVAIQIELPFPKPEAGLELELLPLPFPLPLPLPLPAEAGGGGELQSEDVSTSVNVWTMFEHRTVGGGVGVPGAGRVVVVVATVRIVPDPSVKVMAVGSPRLATAAVI